MNRQDFHMFIPAQVETALNTLEEAGFEAYLVGGCVRDALLGLQPEDFDITTNALPAQTRALFEPRYKLITTGVKHGTIAPIIDRRPIEITTYRIDGGYSDNRHPDSVHFSGRIEDDLARRDFTVNALAFSPARGLVDAFDSLRDLESGTIRCVGEADVRFGEDALRIMRALRFSAVLGFEIEPQTAASIRKNIQSIRSVSAERIYTELKKLLSGKEAARVLAQFPCLWETLFGFSPSERAVRALEGEREAIFRLALLFAGEDAAALQRLKPDNKTYRYVKQLGELYQKELAQEQTTASGLAMFMHQNNIDVACMKALLRMHALLEEDFRAQAFPVEEAAQMPLSVRELAIGGEDLLARGITGKALSRELERLLEAVIRGEVKNEKEALLKRESQHN